MVTLNRLTEREVQVLHQLKEGHSYREVAVTLKISVETVRKHTGNMYTKLDAKNRTQAIKKYFGY